MTKGNLKNKPSAPKKEERNNKAAHKSGKKTGTVADIPVLDYDQLEGRSFTIAYTQWLLAMHVYVGTQYGDMKRVFNEENPRYPEPPQVDIEDLYREVSVNPSVKEQVYENAVHNEIMRRRITIAENLCEEYRVQRGKVYTLVWGQLY